ncbi:AAA domain-containing protein [Roseinatronobacter sp. S2]|uniref:AAA domain-containing protein n=1 Tax=Roseinatronobacter sp. S2 TaxID=3035471 RepID=UPI0024107CC1|nr:AAA domain-containing protein [Roseinatronobacter sp. S2]WFE76429.1 AAA domain-containing protein [Roseinatronobacter sp. S2]
MALSSDNLLRYWRTSLADGALGEGKFTQADRKRFVDVPGDTVKSGVLTDDAIERVFRGQASANTIGIRLWPLVMARKSSHGATRAGGLPELVAPVVTEATVDREGRITPTRNALARDLLTPLPFGEFAIGTVDTLDAFLTETPLPEMSGEGTWQEYLVHCRMMVDAVSQGWPRGDADYQTIGSGFLELAEDANATVRGILDLYDKLLTESPVTPLLKQVAQPKQAAAKPDHRIEQEFSRRLGHSNSDFPLAEHQRQVLAWLDASTPGEVIAVNGPPGTGKTTMLLSAVAGLWVRAALRGEEPPVIVAASSNNQAVTNIIDAFGKDFGKGEGPFAGRWLPGVDSFGMFLASHSRRLEAARRYQTEEFQVECESVAYVQRAKEAYLQAAEAAFPKLANPDLASVVAALQKRLAGEVEKLAQLDSANSTYHAASAAMKANLGADPGATEAVHVEEAVTRKAAVEKLRSARAVLDQHLASESFLTAIFSFLPSVKNTRALRARLAIGDLVPGLETAKRISDIDERVRTDLRVAEEALQSAEQALAKVKSLRRDFHEAEMNWASATEALGGVADLDELERRADLDVRFFLFLLATHYWEGRWLLEMEADLAGIVASKAKKGKASVIPRWHRRMMLTPCAVATFASLPGKMTYTRRDGGKWATEYLFDFIDLLIVDEAGQVLPEVAGASFSLAKRALVIGDTQQIEPISSVPRPVDVGNLRSSGLLASDAEIDTLAGRGICSTTGSAMRLAQQASRVSPYPDLEKGLYLFEHRRCYDEIISFSNALCYKGKLRPLRGKVPTDAGLPALGYLHIDGRAFAAGGSRANPLEAQTIAAWLDANRAELEARYSRPLEQIVGIVTPFGRQVREIREACASRRIAVEGREGMTIGTVHALQGAERPVVIFSPVYSKHADGGFIDSSPSMLNVTVSRAKDSCLVFGDMDALAAAQTGSPRAILGDFLFASEANALEFAAEPRTDLKQDSGQIQMLRDAVGHDAFLLDALSAGGRRYTIVSPWVIATTMERVGLLAAFEAAVRRGAEIDVFADPLLNMGQAAGGVTQMEAVEKAFSRIGVRLHKLPKLHSKIVAIDTDLLCIGSYNWLSADRHGQYARHETSFVYRGQHLEEEISTILGSLKRREK